MEPIHFFEPLLELWSHAGDIIYQNVDWPKVISVLFAAITTLTTIALKWRSTGYRQMYRLQEFLEQQETRLTDARKNLSSHFRVPSPGQPDDQPAFCSRRLGRTLKKMHWGYGIAGTNDLKGAVQVSANQAKLARLQAEEHQKRQALAHLLLGARAAARTSTDPVVRQSARATALVEFDSALKINPEDTEALEYAAMMLLELANPQGALDRLNDLIALRLKEGGHALARAYQLQANAFERLPIAQNGNANAALSYALQCMPDDRVIERAAAHEHQGVVRMKLRFYPAANRSFQDAMLGYQSRRSTPEGEAGLNRVMATIADLNRQHKDGQAMPGNDGTTLNSPLASQSGSLSGLFTRFAKPNG